VKFPSFINFRSISVCFAILLVFVCTIWVLIRQLERIDLESILQEKLDYPIHLEQHEIHWNGLMPGIRLNKIQVSGQYEGTNADISIRHLDVNPNWWMSLWRQSIVLDSVVLHQPIILLKELKKTDQVVAKGTADDKAVSNETMSLLKNLKLVIHDGILKGKELNRVRTYIESFQLNWKPQGNRNDAPRWLAEMEGYIKQWPKSLDDNTWFRGQGKLATRLVITEVEKQTYSVKIIEIGKIASGEFKPDRISLWGRLSFKNGFDADAVQRKCLWKLSCVVYAGNVNQRRHHIDQMSRIVDDRPVVFYCLRPAHDHRGHHTAVKLALLVVSIRRIANPRPGRTEAPLRVWVIWKHRYRETHTC